MDLVDAERSRDRNRSSGAGGGTCLYFVGIFGLLEREGTEMKELIKRFWYEEEGGDLSEYALLIVLASLVAIIAIVGGGTSTSHTFSNTQANTTASS